MKKLTITDQCILLIKEAYGNDHELWGSGISKYTVRKVEMTGNRITGDAIVYKGRHLLDIMDHCKGKIAGTLKCRICGCTEDKGCRGGCHWVEYNLCSKCGPKVEYNVR